MVVMKKDDRIILQRERLYKEVWRTPAVQLAKKYGLSDVGLAKICKRMNIPLPPRGHWAKQAYGYKMKTPPLPPMDSKGVKQVMLDKSAQELLDIAKNRLSTSQLRFKDTQHIRRLHMEMNEWEISQRIRTYVAAMRAT